MGLLNFYLQTFNDDGTYTGEFTKISQDVVSVSPLNQSIESNDYNVGVVRNTGFNIILRNDKGLYSDAENIRSLFNLKRRGSIVKVTWTTRPYFLQCGSFICGQEFLGTEVNLFEGVINDVTTTSNIEEQRVKFTILGYESVLSEITVPYSSITNGDMASDAIFACINQAPFTTLVTVNALNVDVGFDVAIDDKTSLENKTVSEALSDLLLASNSVLYIKNNIVYVTSRAESLELIYTFYGQASPRGIENIINIPTYKDGLSRLFNFWTWSSTSLKAENLDTIDTFGVRKKELSIDFITDNTKRNNILDSFNNEFSDLKIELELLAPLNYATLQINILDKVNVDYPTIQASANENNLPVYGSAIYGRDFYPYGQWSLTVDKDINFKVIGKKIDMGKDIITFSLREV